MSVEMNCEIEGIEEFRSTMGRFDSNMQENVNAQLTAWASEVEESARKLVPVRTGHLRDTIYSRTGGWIADVGAEAEYAFNVEFGSRYSRARPYLRPALQQHLPRLEQTVSRAVDSAVVEAGF